MEFTGVRLTIARELAGLSMADLARTIGASRQSIQFLERDDRSPSPEMVEALGDALGFNAHFFAQAVDLRPTDEDCSFRKRSTARIWMQRQAAAHVALVHLLIQHIENEHGIAFPQLDIPSIEVRFPLDAETAAEQCRDRWGLGDGPISNMTRVVERAGIIVANSIDGAEIDAVSWNGPRPIMVQSLAKQSTSRSRFDLAHELGHLVMHGQDETRTQEHESQADRFASAFLLPALSFRREFPRGDRLDWAALFDLKARWGVSLAAIIRRAYDLSLISAAKYRSAYVQIRARGWHRGEPDEPQGEQPEALPNAIRALIRRGIATARELAMELGWSEPTFAQLTGIAGPDIVVPFPATA